MQTSSKCGETGRIVYSVSELNRQVKNLLEQSFPLLWIEGELSNLAQPRSGHWYFTLKDNAAGVRCAMFRARNQLIRFRPQDGMQLLVRARIGLYAPRGDYQLIVEHMEEAGDGALRRAFEALRERLRLEGLFDDERKRPLPAVPRRIGVITSPTGAAIRDVINVLRRRFPLGQVMIYPVPVQGNAAAPAIVAALKLAAERNECDVLLLTRGGGSLEDLWAFNEEIVARAVAASPIPVVAGIGHEVDFTIADFVADQRAPTPSAAAELTSPDQTEWQNGLLRLQQALERIVTQNLSALAQQVRQFDQRLYRQHPGRQLETRMQRLDEVDGRLRRAARLHALRLRERAQVLNNRLRAAHPGARVHALDQQSVDLNRRLNKALQYFLERYRSRIDMNMRALHAVSPLATLERGYAIATIADENGERVITRAATVELGDDIALRLHQGQLRCRVQYKQRENES